jgi:hypothetical protein
MAKRLKDGIDRNFNKRVWGCRGRDDVAVDVMTIVGSVLWGSGTFSRFGSILEERRFRRTPVF